MDQKGLSAYQINKEAGLAKGLITNAFSKKLGITSGTIESLLNAYPDLNANWLIVGRGTMLLNDAEKTITDTAKITEEHIGNLQEIQDRCVELVKQIQQLKMREQAREDNRLLSDLKF